MNTEERLRSYIVKRRLQLECLLKNDGREHEQGKITREIFCERQAWRNGQLNTLQEIENFLRTL